MLAIYVFFAIVFESVTSYFRIIHHVCLTDVLGFSVEIYTLQD